MNQAQLPSTLSTFLALITPNKDQSLSIVRTVVKAIGGGLAAHGISVSPDIASAVAGPEALQVYAGIVFVVVPAAFDLVVHSLSGKVAAVEAIPGVANVVVKPDASPALAAIAEDRSRPKVIDMPMPLSPRQRS